MMNNTPPVWIGVDLGTTGVRAVAYDLTGHPYANQQAFYPLLTPREGYAEENPRQVLEATFSVVKKAVEEIRYQGIPLAGIALSTVMHSFIALDAQHEPLTNLITWADSRSASIVQKMKKDTAARSIAGLDAPCMPLIRSPRSYGCARSARNSINRCVTSGQSRITSSFISQGNGASITLRPAQVASTRNPRCAGIKTS